MAASSRSRLLTVQEASRRLPFSEPALRWRIAKGQLRPIRIAGRIYLDEAEIKRRFGPLYRPEEVNAPRGRTLLTLRQRARREEAP